MASGDGLAMSGVDAGSYFRIIGRALGALDEILTEDKPGPWGNRPNRIINSVAMDHLARLRRNFQAWDMRRMYSDTFQVDAMESGFPVFRNVMDLERTRTRIDERIGDVPDTRVIRREMLDLILKFKQHPGALQKTMAERLYLEILQQGEVFPAFHAPETVRVSVDKNTGRLVYIVHWAAYDGIENLPIVYLAMIEDSSSGRSGADARGIYKSKFAGKALGKLPGLPNADLSDAFNTFAANHSQYGLTLTSIATALDRDFEHLHPKQLRRFVLGPFYGAGQTKHPNAVQQVLDSAKTPDRSWVLTWTMQELRSHKEKPAEHGMWSKTPAEQIYFIDTNNVECVQQGVSSFTRNALVPHDVYQAVFASGVANSVFADHECAILSEDQILRNV